MVVLLVHGLGRTSLSLRRLGRRLGRAGHTARYFGYAPWLESCDRIVARLAARLEALDARGEAWAAVGHSLGGLLLRAALARSEPTCLAHLIMLGTPNHPPRLARRVAGYAPFRWFAGECGQRLASTEFFAGLPSPSYDYTVLAGVRGFHGSRSPFGQEPNDGIVALSEARVKPEDQVPTFPVMHSFMMNHAAVQAAVLDILDRHHSRA